MDSIVARDDAIDRISRAELKRIYSETNCSIFKEFDVKIKDFRIDTLATKFYAIYQS